MKSSQFNEDEIYAAEIVKALKWEARLGRIAARPFINRVIRGVAYRLIRLEKLGASYANLERMNGVINAPATERDRNGYFSEGDVYGTLNYRAEILSGLNRNSESKILYAHQEKILREVLSQPGITGMFNLGVCYAYIDALLAREFPELQFDAIDLSPLVKHLNEYDFNDIPNLHFHGGNALDHFKPNSHAGRVFFTSRTLVCLSKSDVLEMLGAAHDAGFSAVVGTEVVGISRLDLTPYVFSLVEQPSIVYRRDLAIHNYPEILDRSGYTITKWEFLKTNHPHPDYRILSFVAERKS